MRESEITTIAEYAEVFKLLGDKTRLSILKVLDRTESCVCHFAGVLGISQSAVSQHMRRFKDFGLVTETPYRQWILFSLNEDSKHYRLIKTMLDQVPDDLVDIETIKADMLEMTRS